MSSTIAIGADVCRVARVATAYSRYGDRFLRRFLHPTEVASVHGTATSQPHRIPTLLGGRWAAKEAVFKAFPPPADAPRLQFPDLEVVTASHGSPTVVLHGAAADHAARLGVTRVLLSLSHDGDYAFAVALLQGADPASTAPTS